MGWNLPFFPFGGTSNFLVVIFVENEENGRCRDIASVILLNTSRMSLFYRCSISVLLLPLSNAIFSILIV